MSSLKAATMGLLLVTAFPEPHLLPGTRNEGRNEGMKGGREGKRHFGAFQSLQLVGLAGVTGL